MKLKYLSIGLHTLVLTLASLNAQAEDERTQMLERALRERDQVILELLERVETLEQRVGVSRQATDTQGETPATPASSKDLTQSAADEPGRVVVEEGDAERALERSLTREGALLLPSGVMEIEPGVTFSRQEDSAPSFVMSNGEVFAGERERNSNDFAAALALRLGLPLDSQLEIAIPYRWRKIQNVTQVGFAPTDAASDSAHGWGDLRIGLAKTLLHEARWRPDLIGRLTWDTDSGELRDGIALGDGFQQLRASLTAIKRQDPIAFVGGMSYEHAFENDRIMPGPTISASFGGFIALSPESSLRLSISGAYQDETELSGTKIDGSDRTFGTLVVGSSTLIAPGVLLNFSAGIGLTDDADDFSLTFSIPIRLSPLY